MNLFTLIIILNSIVFAKENPASKKINPDASLNFYISSYPKSLNPLVVSTSAEVHILGVSLYPPTIFDRISIIDPDNGSITCWLCESYQLSKDKMSITYKLNKNAKFHDGKPVTAEDLAFTFKAMLHPKVDNLGQKASYLSRVKSYRVIDRHTFKIHFKEPKFSNVSVGGIFVMPKHRFPDFDKAPEKITTSKFGRAPMGSGPYKFKSWTSGRVELERNDEWWGFKENRFKNLYRFAKLRFKIITDSNVALQAFKKNQFDFMRLVPASYDDLRDSTPKKLTIKKLKPSISSSFHFIGWNNRLPIFQDPRTRHALGMLTDRFSTLKKFAKGHRIPTNGPIGVKSEFSCPIEKCPIVPYSPKQARKLLAEVGWKDTDDDGILDKVIDGKKTKLSFSFLSQHADYNKNVLGTYVTAMKKAGVEVKLKMMDWTAMIGLIDEQKFEAYYSGYMNLLPISWRALYHSSNTKKGGSNPWGLEDQELDKLIESYLREFDRKKRVILSQKIHERIYNSHAILYHNNTSGCMIGHSKLLKGVDKVNYRTNCVFWARWFKEN